MSQAREDINYDIVYSMGITGKGVDVAVLGTGVYLHEDLRDRVTAFTDYINQRPQPYDDNGHGTYISAMIGGSGASSEKKYGGVAPGCSLMSVKMLGHKGNGYASDALAGLKWIREHVQEYSIHVVNIPVGSLSRRDMTKNSILVRGVSVTWGDGLAVVVAVGSHDPGRMTITASGISHKIITVGRSDDHKEVEVMGSRMVDYSGRGLTLACICKPDIVALGPGIISCCNEPGRYFSKSGTSMSAPLISGAAALLLGKYLEVNNKDMELRIHERAVSLGLPHNQQGWGELDVARLLED